MPIPEKPLPSPSPQRVENKVTPTPVSNQELLTQQIEQELKASDVVYEQTDGKNFVGA